MTAQRLLVAFLFMVLATAALAAGGPTFADWTRSSTALQQDPDVVRYYTFGEAQAAATPVASLVGPEASLRFSVTAGPGEPEDNPRQVAGRFAERGAIQLNRGVYSGPLFPVEGKRFSVEAWVRAHGQGDLKGDQPQQSATLLSQGNGYWDGWRITLSYPGRTLGLELGKRPGSFGIHAAAPMADDMWHHVVATWDGQRACLYVDGSLLASGEYSGDYVAPAPSATFRLGFADAGWGSAVTDYDEVVIYRRALSPLEVAQHTLFYAPLPAAVAEALAAANARLAGGDAAGAAGAYSALLKQPGLDAHWQAAVRLRLAEAYARQQQSPAALKQYLLVLETPGLPEGLQALALTPVLQLALQSPDLPQSVYDALLKRLGALPAREQLALRMNLAASLARSGKTAAAARQYEAVLAMPELTARDKLEITLQMGHSLTAQKQYQQARKRYASIAAAAEAPASYRSYALLCSARTYLKEKGWQGARGEYQQLLKLADAPEVQRWEAAEGLRELARMAQGLPARDPADSRVKLPRAPAPALQLYVAGSGADTGDGTRARPFATLARAQAAARELIARGLPQGGLAINVGPGLYPMKESLALTAADSGTEQAPVVWRATQRRQTILSGGRALSGFVPVTDAAVLERLPVEARGKVVQVDLKAVGITQYGELKPRGFSHGGGAPALELFCNGEALTPARWPNEGFVQTKAALSNDDKGAVFSYEGDRPARWAGAKDPWVFGYWKWGWADSRDPLLAIDPQERTLRIPRVTYGGLNAGAPYFVYNLLEEIDRPGEWYLDRQTGLLYLYPTADPAQCDLQVSLLAAPLVTLQDASFVRLEGLTLEYGQGTGISLSGGRNCLLAGCTVRHLSGDAVIIDGGSNHGVLSCDLYDLGRGGTRLAGGNRKTLSPGGHFVENCDIHHFSRVDRTYTPAVLLDGCGNRIAHNSFHHTPCHAMRIEGNDHLIEFNDVHDVVRESDDQGGVDMWGDPSYRGVVFRYNYWHDIGTAEPTPCGQAGIRLDDAISGVLIYGNVFCRCSSSQFGAVQLHGGKEDVICNNLFVDCRFGISFSGWGPARWKEFLDSEWIQKKLTDVQATQPPYSTKYPALAHLYENEGVHQVWRNLAYGCGSLLTRDRGLQDLMDNTVTLGDPGFTNAAKGDFTMRPDAPLLQNPGFRPIPFGEIGLYQDQWRGK